MGLLKNIMGELSAMGVAFNLDDYGTGYSNISLISQYPFSTIKVDLSLTWSYFKGENTILPHIVKMIREMGKNVTVEGVETEKMAKELKQMNVNDLQGYYFAKPLPPEAFLSYLKTSS
jgi:EAL domain-containing protein (putative c-di-GMP-specific phosphodiesterase class I)